jgi:hypothetical protein
MTDLERIQFVQGSKRGMGWSGITWSVPLPDGTKKVVVNNCSGFVKGGDVLAIMGMYR